MVRTRSKGARDVSVVLPMGTDSGSGTMTNLVRRSIIGALIPLAVCLWLLCVGSGLARAEAVTGDLVHTIDQDRPPTEEDWSRLGDIGPLDLTLRVPQGNVYSDPEEAVPAAGDLEGYEFTLVRLTGIDLARVSAVEREALFALRVSDVEAFGGTRPVQTVGVRTTGADGNVTFSALTHGIYLLTVRDTVPTSPSRVRWVFTPLLLMMPVWNGERWETDVTVNIKGVPNTQPSRPEKPDIPPSPTPPPIAFTGASLMPLLPAAAVLLGIGVGFTVLAGRRKGNLNEGVE